MEEIIYLLFSPVPLWVSFSTMILGWVIGFFKIGFVGLDIQPTKMLSFIIQILVVYVWFIGSYRAASDSSVSYPPIAVNLIFGAVMGSLNHQWGEYFVEFLKQKLIK